MGIKEKMMNGMMGNMSAEEKKAMMDSMMDSFFTGMTAEEKSGMMGSMMEKFIGSMSGEEKKAMMSDMMPKMMGAMMGGGGMKNMMKGMKTGEGFNPMEMCQRMMTSVNRSSEMAAYATPELRGLFDEWLNQIEEEMLQFIRQNGTANAEKIAEHFKLSKESASHCLSRLAQKGKITIVAEKID